MDEEAYINEILNLQAENDRLRRDYQELLTKTKAALERMESILNLRMKAETKLAKLDAEYYNESYEEKFKNVLFEYEITQK